MWPWIERWRDWAMNDLLPLRRIRLPGQALHASYEKAGLTLPGQPVPWNADAVVVEAQLRLPLAVARRKTDFTLTLAGSEPVAPESLRREGSDDRYRLVFRLPPPKQTGSAELRWRRHTLGQVQLTVQTPAEFLAGLRVQLPTLSARLGTASVACQTFVAAQCKGLIASAVLASTTGLAPLMDLGLTVEFRNERDGTVDEVAVPLAASQYSGRQALVTVAAPRVPRRVGSWVVSWKVGPHVLAQQRARAISQAAFLRSLRIVDTRFVVEPALGGGVQLKRQLPPLAEVRRAGPCFLVASREAGMAGNARVSVLLQGGTKPAPLLEQSLLVTDGPALCAPGTVDVAELGQLTAFELRVGSVSLGSLSLCPVPTAAFTSEGGFKAPAADFPWGALAEEELAERLGRLLNDPGANE